MKSYTDIEQSKKLAKILSLKSADMYYEDDISVELGHGWHPQHTPCWSLATLLDVLPDFHLKKYVYNDGTSVYYTTSLGTGQANTKYYDNPVDACYEIILKLHELKML